MGGELSLGEVLQSSLVRPLEKVLVVEICGDPIHLIDPGPALSQAAVLAAVLRHFKPGTLSKELHCLTEVQIFDLHDEGYHISSGAAAEAVKVWVTVEKDRTRRGLFRVEGTIADVVPATLYQLDI